MVAYRRADVSPSREASYRRVPGGRNPASAPDRSPGPDVHGTTAAVVAALTAAAKPRATATAWSLLPDRMECTERHATRAHQAVTIMAAR